MIRNALLVVTLTSWANIALAQDFPVWERLLRHYSGKTDETPVPSMKMGRQKSIIPTTAIGGRNSSTSTTADRGRYSSSALRRD